MTQERWRITSLKQENGVWGSPNEHRKMSGITFPPDDANGTNKYMLLHSAICIMVAEAYPKRPFETLWYDSTGFTLHFLDPKNYWTIDPNPRPAWFRFRYDEWFLKGNIIWGEQKGEHAVS